MAPAEGPSISIRKSGSVDLNKLVVIAPADAGRRLHDLRFPFVSFFHSKYFYESTPIPSALATTTTWFIRS